ncbi:MAG TPA: Fe-Mn family superoxide dismutase [Chlamydiales bacterium]|nr:Fe-Mn family superoxide dismutase [Chlamydiales bacterium]
MRWLYLLLIAGNLIAAPAYVAKDYSHLLGMPGFSDNLLQMHFKLYEGYVKNANDLLVKLESYSNSGQFPYEYGALKRRLGWEFDGMRLHELYFGNLGSQAGIDKKSQLYIDLVAQFGSFDKWKKDFIATGTIRGIGWAVLYFDPQQKRLINTWVNEHDVGHLATATPLLIMDVFEHAYMPQYGLDKAKYIDAFFNNIDWKVVTSRYLAQ